tara:strand:- start:147 stop:1574 length:1428 start_codon:yes stop_codon:yes gene_type:complete
MSDVASSNDAFVALMAAAKDPWYTMVIYRAWLEQADPEEPLWRTPYFGQVVRIGTAEALFKQRKHEHEIKAAREDKDLGFHAVLDMYGPGAIKWEILSFKSGPRTAMQELANAEEMRLIDENGGVLRDMDDRMKQTLNLTKGGKGDARAVWAGIDAWRRRALTKFKAAMEEYVAKYGSALVPKLFVAADGYKLGCALGNFRQGHMNQGIPEEAEIQAWAEALPKWAWNATKTDEYREWKAQRGREQTREALLRFKSAMEAHVVKHGSALVPTKFVDADGYPLGERLHKFRQGVMRNNLPEEAEVKAWAEALPKWAWNAMKTDELRDFRAQSAKNQWDRETEDQKAGRIAKKKATEDAKTKEEKAEKITKIKTTMATDESKAKRSKLAIVRQATKRRAELEHARPIAVPFVKSKKCRMEMRAASTDFSGLQGNVVLYMYSEDGKTIRSVAKDGDMGKKYIVGPVVDPVPPDAFDSD